MSTAIAGPSTPSQPVSWQLSLPSDIALDDSFSRDLIQLFDKKRTRLHASADDSRECSSSSLDTGPSQTAPEQRTVQPPQPQQEGLPPVAGSQLSEASANGAGAKQRRRQSAGDLLRRSSAYLRAKLEAIRGPTRSHDNLRSYQSPRTATSIQPRETWSIGGRTKTRRNHVDETFFATSSSASLPPPSKIAVNTTITLPQFSKSRHRQLSPAAMAIQPPVITQFPPKPLKYSPVEPLPDHDGHGGHGSHRIKQLAHRLSLPVLRRGGQYAGPRRRSDAGQHYTNSSEKQTKRLSLMSCLESNAKKKGKGQASGSAASMPALFAQQSHPDANLPSSSQLKQSHADNRTQALAIPTSAPSEIMP